MRSRHLIQRSTILGIAIVAPLSIMAYPIPPAPLWRLVHDADAIVVATVMSVEVPPPTEARTPEDDEGPMLPQSVARLRVTQRWKGETEADIAVPFEPNMVCPAPPRYEPGSTVLAFLARDDRSGAWLTVHLSYGTLYPSSEAIPVYSARVREALELQTRKPLERAERIDWLVRCAENRATRWDGIYELVGTPKGSFSDPDELRISPAELLTDEHRQRIAQGFVREPKLDHTVPLMLKVLGSYRDKRLDRALIAAVDREFEVEEPGEYLLRATIPSVLSRLGDDKADSRLPKPAENWQDKGLVETIRQAWVAARAAVVAHD